MTIFFSNQFKEKNFLKILTYKKNIILDFGCGLGVWNKKKLSNKIHKIFLYDKNKEVVSLTKKNYKKSKKIFFIDKKHFFNKKKFFKKNKVNIILMNSVIQYINRNDLKNLILMFEKCVSEKKYKIIITDIPIYSRFIEIFLLLFFNFNRFVDAIKLIFNFSYHKTLFYKNNIDMKFIEKKFSIKKCENLNNFIFRKTLILTKND